MTTDISVAIEGPVATVALNRPQQRNAITFAMWNAIPSVCADLEANPDVRVVVWRGAGDIAFSAGGDIGEFEQYRSNRDQARLYNGQVQAALESVLVLSKPTVALIRGFCVGGGFILAAHCDLRIAADDARFAIPVAKLGALITYEQMQRFVHLIGEAAVLDLLLTARMLDAKAALTCGLCGQVLPAAEIDGEVTALAQRMARLSPLSQRLHKRMVETVSQKPELAQLSEEEWAVLDQAFDSEDYAEGTRAFLEKRLPTFTGQ